MLYTWVDFWHLFCRRCTTWIQWWSWCAIRHRHAVWHAPARSNSTSHKLSRRQCCWQHEQCRHRRHASTERKTHSHGNQRRDELSARVEWLSTPHSSHKGNGMQVTSRWRCCRNISITQQRISRRLSVQCEMDSLQWEQCWYNYTEWERAVSATGHCQYINTTGKDQTSRHIAGGVINTVDGVPCGLCLWAESTRGNV